MDFSSKESILKALKNVKDPEIPTVSIIDLGMLHNIVISSNSAEVKLIPTFLGCPALDIIKENAKRAIEELNMFETVKVTFLFTEAWTTDRISDEARQRLKEFGIAPPPRKLADGGGWEVDCPYCGSPFTTLENIFGPTSCRSILYCRSCRNPFEAMKPISTVM